MSQRNLLMDKVIKQINNVVMDGRPYEDIYKNPKLHIGMNPVILTMRQDIFALRELTVRKRRERLYKLYKEEFLQEEEELNQVDLARIDIVP